MPMDFPDLASLVSVAKARGFRQPHDNESEAQYRAALADCIEPIDFLGSCEIRNKVGRDKFSDEQNMAMIEKKVSSFFLNMIKELKGSD